MVAPLEFLVKKEIEKARSEVPKYFTPATPIQNYDLFAGRLEQINRVLNAIGQPGLHGVLYGERGVGKTSLANVLPAIGRAVSAEFPFVKVNCTAASDFSDLWRKALGRLTWDKKKQSVGFVSSERSEAHSLAEQLAGSTSAGDVLDLLRNLNLGLVVVFDEFDRLGVNQAQEFADLLKGLSDNAVPTTVVLVGVADTIAQLVLDHESIERSIVQVHMPRMTDTELDNILDKGEEGIGIEFSAAARTEVVSMSQGLPHYTHLLAKASANHALAAGRLSVNEEDVREGIQSALRDAQHSIRASWHQATTSARSDALFRQVLLACALAEKDEMGFYPDSTDSLVKHFLADSRRSILRL